MGIKKEFDTAFKACQTPTLLLIGGAYTNNIQYNYSKLHKVFL